MRIFIFPSTGGGNPYIEYVMEGLESNGSVVVNKDKKSKLSRLFSMLFSESYKPDVYHFNWIENYSVENTFKYKVISSYFLHMVKRAKRRGKIIAWTVHNKEPHNLDGHDDTMYNRFMSEYVPLVDVFFIHAKETKEFLGKKFGVDSAKVHYVPQGAYDLSKAVVEPDEKAKFSVLSFGMIHPYKNIPVIVKAFEKFAEGKDARLHICGKCTDASLESEIIKTIDNHPKIVFDNRFVLDEELELLLGKASVIALPYDTQSMNNSGVAALAFTHGRPVVSTTFGSMSDIKEKSFVFTYDYMDEADNINKLSDELDKLYRIWTEDREQYIAMMKDARRYVVEELSWDTICKDMIEAYLTAKRGSE